MPQHQKLTAANFRYVKLKQEEKSNVFTHVEAQWILVLPTMKAIDFLQNSIECNIVIQFYRAKSKLLTRFPKEFLPCIEIVQSNSTPSLVPFLLHQTKVCLCRGLKWTRTYNSHTKPEKVKETSAGKAWPEVWNTNNRYQEGESYIMTEAVYSIAALAHGQNKFQQKISTLSPKVPMTNPNLRNANCPYFFFSAWPPARILRNTVVISSLLRLARKWVPSFLLATLRARLSLPTFNNSVIRFS